MRPRLSPAPGGGGRGDRLGWRLLNPWSPARPAREEDDAQCTQVSRGGDPAAGSQGPTPGARRPPSAGAGAGTRGGGREGAGSGWERSGSGGGGRSSALRLEVAAPVIQGASIPLRQRVGAAGAQRSGAPEPTCAGGDAAGGGAARPGEGLGDSGLQSLSFAAGMGCAAAQGVGGLAGGGGHISSVGPL